MLAKCLLQSYRLGNGSYQATNHIYIISSAAPLFAMGAGALRPGQIYSRHDIAVHGLGTGLRGALTRNSVESDKLAVSLVKKVVSLEKLAKIRFRPLEYSTKATKEAEASEAARGPPTRSSSSSSSSPSSLSAAHVARLAQTSSLDPVPLELAEGRYFNAHSCTHFSRTGQGPHRRRLLVENAMGLITGDSVLLVIRPGPLFEQYRRLPPPSLAGPNVRYFERGSGRSKKGCRERQPKIGFRPNRP